MSWLSKLVGGKTLKIAAIAAAGYAGKNVIWGPTTPIYGGNLRGYGPTGGSQYVGGNFVTDFLRDKNVTPFSDTAVGSFLSPVTEFLRPESMKSVAGQGFGSTLAGVFSGGNQRRSEMPSPGVIQPTSVRTDTNFGAGQAQMLPIGSRGQLDAALGSEAIRQYMARQVKMMGLPSVQGLPPIDMSSSTLQSTTAQRRRSYKTMTVS